MTAGAASIRAAATAADYAGFATLVTEYVAWCRQRYADDPAFVEQVFGHQGLADELESLDTRYGPPNGKTLLAGFGDDIGGGGTWRALADGSCEMKRFYLAGRLQGRGVGRRLCRALIDDAADAGFSLMRIDTARRFTEALALYDSLGFRPCAPHRAYPEHIARELVFMERPLGPRGRGD